LVSASLALALLSTPAIAQNQGNDSEGFDAHGFQVAALDADVRDPLTLQRPGRMQFRDFAAGAMFEFAEEPLVGTTPNGKQVPVVDDLFALNLAMSSVAHDRLRLDVFAPIFLSSLGPDGPRGAGFGDIRLGGMVLLVAPESGDGGFGLGFSPFIDIPTGNDSNFLGQSNLAAGGVVSASGAFDDLTLTANTGTQINPSVDRANLTGADQITLGIAAGYSPIQSVGVNYEIRGALPLKASSAAGTGTPFEGILTGRYVDASGGFVVGGAAMGLTPGVGAATFRVLVGGGFGTASPEAFDTDKDGIVDGDDKCPDVAGTADLEGCVADLKLRVTTVLNGKLLAGATVRLEGPTTHEAVTTASAIAISVGPDSMWRGSASLGDCLTGDKITQVRDEDLAMEISLQYSPAALIRLAVLSVNGNIVSDVRYRFESVDPYCEPANLPGLDDAGNALFDIGVGEHKIIVDAPGYAAYEETFSVGHSDEREVFVLLNPK